MKITLKPTAEFDAGSQIIDIDAKSVNIHNDYLPGFIAIINTETKEEFIIERDSIRLIETENTKMVSLKQ